MNDQPTNGSGSMSVTEVTGLVQLFNNQLLAMEGRLSAKMDDNSRLASERWVKHDKELADNRVIIVARFQKLEESILLVEKSLNAHLEREHEEQLVLDARVRPVKTFAGYLARNWKTILLIIVSILAIIGFSFETLERMVGNL